MVDFDTKKLAAVLQREDVQSLLAKAILQIADDECVVVKPSLGEGSSGIRSEVGASVSYTDMDDDSGESWADQMSDGYETASSVVMPEGVVCGDEVKALKFGGIADVVEVAVPKVEKGFFAAYVRSVTTRQLVDLLQSALRFKVPKVMMEELALCTYSAATVPAAFGRGQERLRSLAAVGDAAMSYLLVADMAARGHSVASVQAVKSVKLSNGVMCRSGVATGLVRCVAFANGVDPGTSKAGADAVEAVAGVLARWRRMEVLESYMRWMQFLV